MIGGGNFKAGESVFRLHHGYYSLLTHRLTMRDNKTCRRKDRKGRKVYAQFKVSDKEGASDEALVIVKEIRNIKEKCSVTGQQERCCEDETLTNKALSCENKFI